MGRGEKGNVFVGWKGLRICRTRRGGYRSMGEMRSMREGGRRARRVRDGSGMKR